MMLVNMRSNAMTCDRWPQPSARDSRRCACHRRRAARRRAACPCCLGIRPRRQRQHRLCHGRHGSRRGGGLKRSQLGPSHRAPILSSAPTAMCTSAALKENCAPSMPTARPTGRGNSTACTVASSPRRWWVPTVRSTSSRASTTGTIESASRTSARFFPAQIRSGRRLVFAIPFPEQFPTSPTMKNRGATTAPPNIWRWNGIEAIMVPVVYKGHGRKT